MTALTRRSRTPVLALVVLLLLLPLAISARTSDVVVNTSDGVVLGSRNGSCVGTFYGIPYAAAPVGERRFRPPVGPEPWGQAVGLPGMFNLRAERFRFRALTLLPARPSTRPSTTSHSACSNQMAERTTLAKPSNGPRPSPRAGRGRTCRRTACRLLHMPRLLLKRSVFVL